MKKIKHYLVATLALGVITGDVEIAGQQVGLGAFQFVADAQARVGRPATPGSVAGVARRTTRRTIRRGAYIATIPGGCAFGSYYGYNLYYCGGVYYQPSGSGYVIVYF
jgi:hypothetical protein